MLFIWPLTSSACKPLTDEAPPWPLHICIENCNVDIAETIPVMEGADTASPSPFIPSLMMIQEAASEEVRELI